MKTKFIVASSLGLLGITSMVIGATTFAANTGTDKMGGYAGTRMMGNREGMMKKFATTGDAQAFRTAVENAMINKDFAAFKAVHVKYGITTNITQDQFNAIIAERANQKKSLVALKSGDYATWKTLNVNNPILTKIDTQAKFKKLIELESYREKMDTIRTELGLEGPQGEAMGMGMGMKEGKGIGMGMKKGNREHAGLGMYSGNNN